MMASWQARVVASLCKLVIKRPLTRSPSLATIRKTLGSTHPAVPRGFTAKDELIGGIHGEWMTADGVTPTGTLLYIHGGAHVTCSPRTHRPITSWFAKQGWRVFAPDYRLAPENRFPAGLEDCVAAYRALLASGVEPTQLVVAGDSAGGNLTLALCLSLRKLAVPQPAAIALFSPVMDFTWSGASSVDNSDRCAMFSKDILPIGSHLYLDQHDPRDPLASPYYADLHAMPPMMFHVGADEILRDDSIRVAEHAKQAGVEVHLKTWPVVPHVWQMLHPFIPEARESLGLMQEFLRRQISP
jgi:acetyl esterase/lipase